MNRKLILLLAFIAVVLAGSGIFFMARNQNNLSESLPIKTGDFLVKNVRLPDLEIIPGDTEKVILDLYGSPEMLEKVNFDQLSDTLAEFSLPEGSEGIRGTITVPKTMLIVDLDRPLEKNRELKKIFTPPSAEPNREKTTEIKKSSGGSAGESGEKDNKKDESEGGKKDGGSDGKKDGGGDNKEPPSPPPDAVLICGDGIISPQQGEECDDGNRRAGDGCSDRCKIETPQEETYECGNGIKEQYEECDDGNVQNDDGCSSFCYIETMQFDENDQCTLEIRQVERDRCCQVVNANKSHPECEGNWMFDYFSRLCVWYCPPQDCTQKSNQEERDQCCATQNQTKPTPPCPGEWVFSASKQLCEFQCLSIDRINRDPTPYEIDMTSAYCVNTYTDKNDRDQCCDEFLKHPLSIGPRPGFPDCIGTWSILPGTARCDFRCVTHEEMIEILKKLEEDKNN